MSDGEPRGKGYDWNQGMSVNAVEAYYEGRFPLSRLRRQHLDDAGIPKSIPVAFARYLADTSRWKPSEFHHTGGTWFNRTDFYRTDDLADTLDQLRDDAKLEELLAEYRAANRSKRATVPDSEGTRVSRRYAYFTGSRRNRRRRAQWVEFTGTLRDGWVHLDTGGRKAGTSRWIEITELTGDDVPV